jgi:hypothetical protein
MSNLSLEELEEADNILLDVYNTVGSIPINNIPDTLKIRVLENFNEIEYFLEKMGVNLIY